MRPRQVRGIVVGVVAAFLLVFAVVPQSRARPESLVLLAVAAYVCYEVRLRLGAGERPVPSFPHRPEVDAPPEEQDVRLARLDAALERTVESPEQFAQVMRPMLRRLATERLRDRTGIDVTADPVGARRQMGDELWQMFSASPSDVGPAPRPEELRDLVAALERL